MKIWPLVRFGLFIFLLGEVAYGQAPPPITSSGLNTQISASVNVPGGGVQHNITGGTRPGGGGNLFHSFGEFGVPNNNIANFQNDSALPTTNILSRVTGGNPSNIFGTIQTTDFGNANLFLLNPAGVIFGPTASLNVGGSFHVSTADYLRLGENGIFYAELAKDSVFTMAPPEAFGFLSKNPASIVVDQSLLQVPDHQTLSFVGGDLSIIGNTQSGDDIAAFGGRIDLISVASPGEAIVNGENDVPDVNVESFSKLGTIDLSNDADIKSRGNGGGTVIIRGGQLLLDNSFIFTTANGLAAESIPTKPGRGIDIQVSTEVNFNNGSSIGHDVFQDLAPDFNAPEIHIQSAKLEMNNSSQITSEIGAEDHGTNIVIDADETILRDGSFIRANTGGPGNSGSIDIKADNLELRDGGLIFSLAFNGAEGRGGDIVIDAESVLLSNPDINGSLTAITAQTLDTSTGNAGDVQVTADSLTIEGGGNTFIQSQTFSSGNGGTITLNISGDISATGSQDNPFNVGIFANTFGPGNAGNLSIFSDNLSFFDHVQAGASAFSGAPGKAGNVVVSTNKLELLHGSNISAAAFLGTGDGGTLNVRASDIVITGVSDSLDPFRTDFTALSVTTNAGRGGNMNVMADNIFISDKGQITSFSRGAGNSGDINIDLTGRLEVTSGGNVIASAFGTGAGGEIQINSSEVHVSGVGQFNNLNDAGISGITSQTGIFGGDAGNITLETNLLEVLDGGTITTSTFGPGAGGNISIMAQHGMVAGLNEGVKENIQNAGGDLDFARSSITSASSQIVPGSFGPAGNITLTLSGEFQLQDQGLVSSATFTNGQGGNITINAADISMDGNAALSAESTEVGNAGSIILSAQDTFQSVGNSITTQANVGAGGSITIDANQLELTNTNISASVIDVPEGTDPNTGLGDIALTSQTMQVSGGSINAETTGARAGGGIEVQTGRANIINGATISAGSSGPGNAGSIIFTAADTILLDGATVITEALQASGGNIKLTAQDLIQLNDSTISSSVQGEANTAGGDINLDPDFIILQNSQILAKAVAGKGGNIDLVASKAVLLDSQSTLDASSQTGISGSVTIESPIQVLSGTIAPLPDQPVNVATLYAARCLAGEGGHFSTFVDSKSDSVAPVPGTFLASPFLPQGSSSSAGAVRHAGTPSGIAGTGQTPPIQLAAYVPPVLFQHGDGMLSACP